MIVSAKNTKELFANLDKRSELADADLKNKLDVFKAEIKGDLGVMKTEMSQLRAEVEKHNGVVERTFRLEEAQKLLEQRIGNLEEK